MSPVALLVLAAIAGGAAIWRYHREGFNRWFDPSGTRTSTRSRVQWITRALAVLAIVLAARGFWEVFR